MKIVKDKVIVECRYSDDGKHRYLYRRTWNSEKPEAMVIMINPTSSDHLVMDLTTMLTINNLAELGFGSLCIVNLYSFITNKIAVRWYGEDELNGPENDSEICKAAEKAEKIILAWGSFGHTTQRVINRKEAVIAMLSKHKKKFACIADSEGRKGLHPLTPSIRNSWSLTEVDFDVCI